MGDVLCAAPEQLLGEPCTPAVDMYSFGILLIELTTRQVVVRRGEWRLPAAPQECPQVCTRALWGYVMLADCTAAFSPPSVKHPNPIPPPNTRTTDTAHAHARTHARRQYHRHDVAFHHIHPASPHPHS